jgi:hypothetical protein
VSRSRAAALALRAYPPAFRERYGDELGQLVDDLGPRRGTALDLARGAVRAWCRPPLPHEPGERARRQVQASLSVAWLAWCGTFLLVPWADRSLLDPPVAALASGHHGARALLDAASAAWALGWLAVVVGAAVVATRLVVPALRRSPRALAPLALPAVLAVVEAAGLGALVAVARGQGAHPSAVAVGVLVAWVAGLAALAATGGITPAIVAARLRPSLEVLRLPLFAMAVAVAAMAAMLALDVAAAAEAHDALVVAVVATVGLPTGAAATCSTARGLRALRRAPA